MKDIDQERFEAQTEFAVREGERWRQQKRAELEGLSVGTVVMINVISGEYITAPSRIEAMDRFDQRFGRKTTLGYSFEVGRPVFIGGGIA